MTVNLRNKNSEVSPLLVSTFLHTGHWPGMKKMSPLQHRPTSARTLL